MCIIIDTNAFADVFNAKSCNHNSFKPVYDWIHSGKGKIVYGGETYKKELKATIKYQRIFIELRNKRKVVLIPDDKVDRFEAEIKNKVVSKSFDDPHLLAIVAVSGCRLICTNEERAVVYIKDVSLYPKSALCKNPKIYRNCSHKNLLVNSNIVGCCKSTKVSV